jgi:hypothetical protein
MRRSWLVPLLVTAGCAQLLGIDDTSAHSDAVPDASKPDTAIDAALCTGGDAHVTDPASGACYVWFSGPAARDPARAMCKTTLGANADLASVQSASENTLISTLVGSTSSYLGGTDASVEGTWLWPDGSPVTFTNWNAGEPNNGLGQYEEDCMVMIGVGTVTTPGLWDDKQCLPTVVPGYGFVCERD